MSKTAMAFTYWRRLGNDVLIAREAFLDCGAGHFDQLASAPPRLLQRHFTTHDPFSPAIHKASFLEIVDGTTNGCTGSRGAQSDAGDHAGCCDG